jgi:phage gp29-like protein
LDTLEKIISDAVARAPEESEITIESLANKGSANSTHEADIEWANAEISKAMLGETLTTEIGGKVRNAAAQAHDLVRKDRAAADHHRISETFHRRRVRVLQFRRAACTEM